MWDRLRDKLAGRLWSWRIYHLLFADYSFLDSIFKAPLLRNYLGSHAGRTLDYGCGGGTYTDLIRTRATVLIAADVQYNGLQRLARRHRRHSNVLPLVCSATALSLAGNSLDTVLCLEVLEHLPEGEDQRCLREFARLLRRGGKLILSTPVPPGYVDDLSKNPYGHRREGYGMEDLSAMLTQTGFVIQRYEYRFFKIYKAFYRFIHRFFERWGFYPPSALVLPALLDFWYIRQGADGQPGNLLLFAVRA